MKQVDKQKAFETPTWIDKHSVNCYFCGALVDERECTPADEYNNNDGGDICRDCLTNIQQTK
jgi:hypothetical protein